MQPDKKQDELPSKETENKQDAEDRELEIENGFFSIDEDENTKTHNRETIDKSYSDTLGVPQENETDELAEKALKHKQA